MSDAATVRRYYDALDAGADDRLEDLLAPEFVQYRPDRTFESRAAFLAFMREERPRPDAVHEIDAIYDDGRGVAVRGRLVDDGETIFEFVDVHLFVNDRLMELRTFAGPAEE